VQVDISLVTVFLGGAASILAAMLRAFFPELDRSPRLKRLSPFFPAILGAAGAVLLPGTVPGQPADARAVTGAVASLFWYLAYPLIKKQLAEGGPAPALEGVSSSGPNDHTGEKP
jgi:hypothetical protein